MRYPTRRAEQVNSTALTIAARRWGHLACAASILILSSISAASSGIADEFQKSPAPSTQSSGSHLTPIGSNSAKTGRAGEGSDRLEPLAPSSANLDGNHLWLALWGARTEAAYGYDSCVGGELAITRVREGEALGLVGGTLGGGRYAESDDKRLWANAVAGTRRGTGWMLGGSAGAVLELSPTARPKLGATVGVWAFVGVVPFARVGAMEGRGAFLELGVEIALPVLRWGKPARKGSPHAAEMRR